MGREGGGIPGRDYWGARGPDVGGDQLSLGRGWQGPHSRGSSERAHQRARQGSVTGAISRDGGWKWILYFPDLSLHHLGTFFLHSFVHSTHNH